MVYYRPFRLVQSDGWLEISTSESASIFSTSRKCYTVCVSGESGRLRVLLVCGGQHPGRECEHRPPGHQPRPRPPCGLPVSAPGLGDGPRPPEDVMIVMSGHTNEAGVTQVIHLARKLRAGGKTDGLINNPRIRAPN